MNGRPWIGVDLDGTLATYHEWVSLYHFGEPVKPMVERIKAWLEEGLEVKVFTARCSGLSLAEAHKFRKALGEWLEAAGLPHLSATCVKDYNMLELYDDRAVQVEINTGQLVGYSTRKRGLH